MLASEFKIYPHVFREYDIRGLAPSELNEMFAYYLARSFGRWIQSQSTQLNGSKPLKLSVGRDCRLTSDSFAHAVLIGLQLEGIEVVDLGVCTTPQSYFSNYHYSLNGSVMITGSHNPAEFNGFKICFERQNLTSKQLQELRALMIDLSEKEINSFNENNRGETFEFNLKTKTMGLLQKVNLDDDYLQKVVPSIKVQKQLKIVIDAGNATASLLAPLLFKKLGALVEPLYCEMDGRFPNHHPDPTVASNLKALVEKVKETKADFGVGFDGDSDRIGVVDDSGRILFGDELLILFAREVLKNHPGAVIISEVKSSRCLFDEIRKAGGQSLMWKTGHSLIKEKMKETKSPLAGEMSGHIFFADRFFGFDDALYAAARLYEICSLASIPLSKMLNSLPERVQTPEIRIDCREEFKFEIVNRFAQVVKKKKNEGSKIDLIDIDGIRVEFEKGWGLLRASNTQPVLVLRFEAFEAKELEAIQEMFKGILEGLSKEIPLELSPLDF